MTANARIDNARIIRAARGSELSAKSWLTEAPLRMLMNNLDPEVAERPERTRRLWRHRSRRARLGDAFDRMIDALKALAPAGGRSDATGPIGQAGRCLSNAPRCAARADRQFQSRAGIGRHGSISTNSIARA